LPGGYLVIEPEFLFTATAYQSSNACASLRWVSRTLATRNGLLEDAIARTGSSELALASAAGLQPNEGERSKLLAALVGRWGEGDAIVANDSACATFPIVRRSQAVPCASGGAWRDGTCLSLSRSCPSNLETDPHADRCSCPAALPSWNFGEGRCESASVRAVCPTSDGDPSNFCRCPSDKPVFNAAQNACMPIRSAQVAANNSASESTTVEARPKPTGKPSSPPGDTARVEAAKPAVADSTVAKPAPVESSSSKHARPPVEGHKTASTQPKINRKRQDVAREEPQPRCRGLQRWGPYMKRCVPLPIYLMGGLFRPSEASAR